MTDLSKKGQLKSLEIRHEPHWHRLDKGQYVGFRRGADTWHVRLRDRAGKQHQSALHSAFDFDSARKAAEKWLRQMGSAPVRRTVRGTVREALETYLDYLREQGRDATAKTIEPKFRKLIWNDALALITLHSLTREDMREWRERLRPGRQARSINRVVRDVQAGLNRALKEGHIGDRQAWQLDPLMDDIDEGSTAAVFLSPGQRKSLIDAATAPASAFMRGLEFTGARPGELAAATVADFDNKRASLMLSHRKGRPAKLRTRAVVLSPEGAAFFRSQARRKLPTARLFLNPLHRPWERKEWAAEIRAAANTVNLKARGKKRIPPGTSAYAFRHSRISELLQVHQIDPLTVALQVGTSMSMLEKYYYKFIPAALREKLAAVDGG